MNDIDNDQLSSARQNTALDIIFSPSSVRLEQIVTINPLPSKSERRMKIREYKLHRHNNNRR